MRTTPNNHQGELRGQGLDLQLVLGDMHNKTLLHLAAGSGNGALFLAVTREVQKLRLMQVIQD